jgi:hypothetical protein
MAHRDTGGGTVVIISGDADFYRAAQRVLKTGGFQLQLWYRKDNVSQDIKTISDAKHIDWHTFLESCADRPPRFRNPGGTPSLTHPNRPGPWLAVDAQGCMHCTACIFHCHVPTEGQ